MKYFFVMIITIMTLIGCGGAEERKAVYLEKAKLSLEAGDLDKARIELKNVLQIDPKEAQAYFQLGDVYDLKNNYKKAYGNYLKAEELNPDNLEYHAKTGSYLLLLMGDIEAAIEKRDFILSKDKNNVGGLLLKAGILFKRNDVAGAKKITQEVFSRQPGHIQNSMFLSSLYLRDGSYEGSINTLSACIKENPNNRQLASTLAETYRKAGKYDLAEKEYKTILEKNPDTFNSYLKLAMFYGDINENDNAEKVLRRSIEADKKDSKRKLALVEFLQQSRGNMNAIEELKNIIVEYPEEGNFRIALARLYIAENNIKDTEKVLIAAISDFSENSTGIKARVYLAKLYMQKENIDSAVSVIEEASKISPNDTEVNFIKAKQRLLKKDYEGAIILLRTVVKDDVDNIGAYLLLSVAHRAIGQKKQAGEIIKQAYENNRTNVNGLITLARYHAKNKNIAELGKIIENCLSIDANNYEALSYKVALLNEKKLYSEARSYAIRMIELHPSMENGYIQSVPHLINEGKKNEAINLLLNGYEKVKDKNNLLMLLISLYVSTDNFDAAINKIRSVIHKEGETAGLYTLIAKTYIAATDLENAKNSLLKAIDIKPDWNEPYLMLADVYISKKQNQNAINILKQGLSKQEGDLKLSLRLSQIFETLGDFKAAINEYEKAYKKNSDNVILINNLAILLSEHANDKNNLKRAKELADKLKNSKLDVILDTVGWVYCKTGYYNEAVNILKPIVDKSPDVPIFNYHLGIAMYKIGDNSAAKTYLTKSLANNVNFPGKEDAEIHLQKLQ